MARLSIQLSNLLTEEVILKLNNYKIYNIIDYLDENPENLFRICKIPFKDLLKIKQDLILNFTDMPKRGLDYYNYILKNSSIIQTYIQGFDDLLDGGIFTQNIIEICGLSGSGKTLFNLNIITNIAQNNAKQVIYYIDTKGDFSGQRIYQILKSRNCTEEEISEIMSRIQVLRILDYYQLCSLLYNFNEQFLSEIYTVRLIIIDSLPSIIYPLLTDNLGKGLGYLNNLSNVLKHIINEYNVAFIIINNITRWLQEEEIEIINDEKKEELDEEDEEVNEKEKKILVEKVKPTLGTYWLSVPNIRLLFERNKNRILISLKKNTYFSSVNRQCQIVFDKYNIL